MAKKTQTAKRSSNSTQKKYFIIGGVTILVIVLVSLYFFLPKEDSLVGKGFWGYTAEECDDLREKDDTCRELCGGDEECDGAVGEVCDEAHENWATSGCPGTSSSN